MNVLLFVNSLLIFRCRCQAGFEGERCEININDCEHNQCENNATCIDLVQGYSCQCALGFKGKDDVKLDLIKILLSLKFQI